MAKQIIINDCMECPFVAKCPAWKKLTKKQKFMLTFGNNVGKFILNDCHLTDFKE